MTFTEAAIEVLRREGKPLHFRKIAEIAVRDSLLDHVGKVPEDTMADQLAAHFRLPRAERRVIPVQAGTFALAEWGLDEDPQGIESLVEPPPEDELPYRGRERHPVPSREVARATGRGEPSRGRRREEEERRGRRFPPPAEVAYEILAGAGRALSVSEIAAQGAERLLMPDAFVRDTASLAAALAEDNRRRQSSGRRQLFQVDGEVVTLVAQPEPGERVAQAAQVAPRAAATPAEARRAGLAALRRRLRECSAATVEHVAARLLEKLGFREIKVAKRGREHVIYTARRRLGLADVRHGVRVLRSGGEATRRDVSELRRDLGHYGAQIGVVIGAGDAARDARGEASAAGQLPVVLLCGEALAEAFADAGLGCVPVVVPEVDEGFFQAATEAAEKEEAARRARREEREEREGREGREGRERREERPPRAAPAEVSVSAEAEVRTGGEDAQVAPARVVEVRAEFEDAAEARGAAAQDDEGEGEAEGDEELEHDEEGAEIVALDGGAVEAPADAPGEEGGERRRRRRRRRRRGGRGRREGAATGGAEGAAAPPAEGAQAAPPVAGGEGPPAVPRSGSEESGAGAPPAAALEPTPSQPASQPPEPTGGDGAPER